mmetsp:Transcript_61629/g.198507  ORF Transcript_61629/g.198507 Transcript_61629/m.198507 type:complete len:709 (-) Transcript_61629:72-2198(-)
MAVRCSSLVDGIRIALQSLGTGDLVGREFADCRLTRGPNVDSLADPHPPANWDATIEGRWFDRDGLFYGGVAIEIAAGTWCPIEATLRDGTASTYRMARASDVVWRLLETLPDGQERHFKLCLEGDGTLTVHHEPSEVQWTLHRVEADLGPMKARSNAVHFVSMKTPENKLSILAEVYRRMDYQHHVSNEGVRNSRRSHRCIIDPLSTSRLSWDVAGVALIGFQVLETPMEMAFFEDSYSVESGPLWWSELAIGLFFLVDLLLNCLTAYITADGLYVRNQWLILRNYLLAPPCYMVIDAVSLLPLVLFVTRSLAERSSMELTRVLKTGRFLRYAKMMRMLRLLRIARAVRTVRQFTNMVIFSGRLATALLQVLQLFLALCIMIHIIACLWRRASEFDLHAQAHGVHPGTVWDSYVLSLWWTVSTLTDSPPIDPLSTEERLLWCATSLLSYTVGAIWLAVFVQVCDAASVDQKKMSRQMQIVKRFIMSHNLSQRLNARIISAINEANYQDRRMGLFKRHIEPLLSEDLLVEISGHVHGDLIGRFPPFRDRGEEECVMQKFRFRLAYDASVRHYSTHDIIIEELRRGDTMIFFVKGKAKLYSLTQRMEFPIFREGWWIGEKVLFWDAQRYDSESEYPVRSATCEALQPCTTLEISAASFRKAVEEFNLGAWLERMIQRGADGEPWGCPCCGEAEHFVSSCPLLRYMLFEA